MKKQILTKPLLSALEGKFNGRPVAVLGGGETLPADVLGLPPNAIYVAANEHAYKLGIVPDYFCFLNDPKQSSYLWPYVQNPMGAVRLSRFDQYSDIDMDIPYWQKGFTGQFGVWLGCHLTDSDVIICGMDLYGAKDQYFNKDRKHPVFRDLVRDELAFSFLRGWKTAHEGVKDSSRVYASGGILTEIFKEYDSSRNLQGKTGRNRHVL